MAVLGFLTAGFFSFKDRRLKSEIEELKKKEKEGQLKSSENTLYKAIIKDVKDSGDVIIERISLENEALRKDNDELRSKIKDCDCP